MNATNWDYYSRLVLRLGIGFVFIWFGWESFNNPDTFSRLVPSFTSGIAAAETLVRIHGVIEMLLGLLLIIGLKTRIVAWILSPILLTTIILLPYGPNMIRDIGILSGVLSLALGGAIRKSS